MSETFLNLKLYTVRDLTQFGICERELYRWARNKWLKPFTYSGKIAKYRYQDFYKACELNMQDVSQRTQQLISAPIKFNGVSRKEEVLAKIKETFLK